MTWFFAILVVLLLGGIAAVASGYGRPLAEAYDDHPDAALGGGPVADATDRPLRGADLRGVRFPLALRGYRMAEVDALLDRLALQLDEQIDEQEPSDDPVTDRADDPGGADR